MGYLVSSLMKEAFRYSFKWLAAKETARNGSSHIVDGYSHLRSNIDSADYFELVHNMHSKYIIRRQKKARVRGKTSDFCEFTQVHI